MQHSSSSFPFFLCLLFNKIILFSSPPDIPELHRLPSMPIHHNDPTTKLSTNTLISDENNGSFEDEENEDEHSQHADQPDSRYQQQQQPNGGLIIKAHALYDFNGRTKIYFFRINSDYLLFVLGHGNNGCQYVNAATIYVGECVDILEDDQGDGWTRIQKLDGSTGFVPSSYLRIDSQKLPTSSKTLDSGRF
jgi:hypothetical protein